MEHETRLAELLESWEDLCEHGVVLSADEFLGQHCQNDSPAILTKLRKQIVALRQMNEMLAESPRSLEETETFAGKGTSSSHPMLRVGAEPVPDYRLVSPLGAGGFGEVWKATGSGDFPVALKFVRLDRPAAQSELRSLEFLRSLRHANLVSTFGAWQREGWLIVAMELADKTLADRLKEVTDKGRKGIPGTELLRYMIDASRGIDFLNKPRVLPGSTGPVGVQHRDIKPQNMLLVGGSLKIADFGIAQVLSKGLADHTGKMSVAFAAPEFFDHRTSDRSDQYSLAVAYCQLRGGRLPFRGSSLQLMKGHIELPPDLTTLPDKERPIVAKALSKQPEERWPSCREFIRAICEIYRSKEREEEARPPPRRPRPIPEKPSRTPEVRRSVWSIRWSVGLISATVLILGILGVWQMPKLLTGDTPTDDLIVIIPGEQEPEPPDPQPEPEPTERITELEPKAEPTEPKPEPTEPAPVISTGADENDETFLDGESLAAGVDLQSKRSAEFKAMLAEASNGFPASCIKATVGELRVGSRLPDGDVDVVIPVAVTVDAEKYQSFDESIRRVLQAAATKQTSYAFEPIDIRAVSKTASSGRPLGRDLTALRVRYKPFTDVAWDSPLYGYQGMSIHMEHYGANYSESKNDYKTCTIMLHDSSERDIRRTNWTAYDIDTEYLNVFAPSRHLVLDVKVRLIDASGKIIAEKSRDGRFSGDKSQPGALEGFSAGGQLMDRLQTNINLVDSGPFEGRSFGSYHMRVLPIGPFFSIKHQNYHTVVFTTELRFSMPFRIHVDELREVKRAECVLSLKPNTEAFATD